MSYYFPNDLLEKILLFLPAKSLVRFCCVSKSWKSCITSSDFIHAHLNRTRISIDNNGKNLLLLRYNVDEPEREQYSLHFDNDDLVLYKKLDIPFHVGGDNYFRVLGSINGLIFLSLDLPDKAYHYILWNPSIRNYISLPNPGFTYLTHGTYDEAIGLGFDSRSKDYKIVRLVSLESEEDTSHRVEIFKLSTGSWETISAPIDKLYWADSVMHQVFLNGAVHWTAFDRNCHHNVILSFEMRDEVFGEIMLPTYYAKSYSGYMNVSICGEWLSLICDLDRHLVSKKEIWAMKEYGVADSWTKLYTFDFRGARWATVGLKKNGDLLMKINNGELVSYDAKIQRINIIGICDYKHEPYGSNFYVGAYDSSLVLLGYGNTPVKKSNVKNKKKKKIRKKKKKR